MDDDEMEHQKEEQEPGHRTSSDSENDVRLICSRDESDNEQQAVSQEQFVSAGGETLEQLADQTVGFPIVCERPEDLAAMFSQMQAMAAGPASQMQFTTETYSDVSRFQLRPDKHSRGGTVVNLYNCQGVQLPQEVADPRDEIFDKLCQMTKHSLKNDDPKRHVSTYAERSASKIFKQFKSIIINGRSGTGKTRIAHKLLNDFARELKITPVEIISPNQWDQIPITKSGGTKYIVMIDDIFGSSTFEKGRFDSWQVVMPSMWSAAENGVAMFIVTSRAEIMMECHQRAKRYRFISAAPTITLDEKEYLLRECEKRKFLKQYCPKINFSEEEMQKLLEIHTSLGFPQCCLFFSKSKQAQKRGIQYFLNPHEFLVEEIAHLYEDDPLAYLILLMIVMKRGSLEANLLNPFKVSKEFEDFVKRTAQACILDSVPMMAKIKRKANELCGIYLTLSETDYHFQHQSVYDAIILNISDEYPEVCVEISPAKVLVDLVRTKTHKRKNHEVIISLTDNCYEVLASRITEILHSGENVDILDHQCLHDQQFVQLLIQSWNTETVGKLLKQPVTQATVETYVMDLRNEEDRTLTFFRNVHMMPLKRICLFKYNHIIAYLILKEVTELSNLMLQSYFDFLSPEDVAQILTCCVYMNRKQAIKMLMNRNVTPVPDTVRSLCAASEIGENLINGVINAFNEDAQNLGDLDYLLSVALFNGNTRMVTFLVNEMKNMPESKKSFRSCLLQLTAQCSDLENTGFNDINFEPRKDFDVVKVMEILMNTNCGVDLDVLADMASGNDDPSLLRYLLQKPVHLNKMDDGRSLLHVAAQFGSYESVVELVNKGANVTLVTSYKDAEVYNETHGSPATRSSVLHFVARSTKDKCKKLEFLVKALSECQSTKNKRHMFNLNIPIEVKEALTEEELNEALIELTEHDFSDHHDMPILTHADVDLKDIKERTPLHLAARFRSKPYVSAEIQAQQVQENCAFVEELIKQGADVNLKDFDDYTAIHYATVNGNIDLVRMLMKSGANTVITDCDGSSLYHFVAGRRTYYKEDPISLQAKQKLGEMFLQAGCDINATDSKGRTCLHEAAKHGDILMLKFLHGKGGNINIQDKDGKTVLHDAAREGDLDMIAFICEKGAKLDIQDAEGQTIVHEAAKSSEDAIEKLFLLCKKEGIPLKAANKRGQTAIFSAAESGDVEIVEFLVEKGVSLTHKDGKGNTLLHRACKYKLKDMVKFLLKHHFDVNEANHTGKTSVHFAVKQTSKYFIDPSILKMLFDADADPNKKTSVGDTPLHILNYMMFSGTNGDLKQTLVVQSLELLIEAGADPNVQDENEDEMTPLHLAAMAKNKNCVRILLDNGADTRIRDIDGRTALSVAMKKGYNDDCVSILLENALNPSQQDKNGNTLLHDMASGGYPKAVVTLLKRGADPHVKNRKGQTAINVVKGVDSLNVLLSHGGNPDHSDDEGMTALHSFAKSKDLMSINSLLEHGANPSPQNKHGNTPIHVVCEDFKETFLCGYLRHLSAVELVNVLKAGGCDISLRNKLNQRAFDIINGLHYHIDAQMETARKHLLRLLRE